jgi:hypothetical protein
MSKRYLECSKQKDKCLAGPKSPFTKQYVFDQQCKLKENECNRETQQRIDQKQIEKSTQQCDSDPVCSQEKENKRNEEEFNKSWYSGLYNYGVKPVGYVASPVVNTATNVVSSVPTVASNAVSGLGYLGSYVTDPMGITNYGQISEAEIYDYRKNPLKTCNNYENIVQRTNNCIRNSRCDDKTCEVEIGKTCKAFMSTLDRNKCRQGGKKTRKQKKSKKTARKSRKHTKKSRKHRK